MDFNFILNRLKGLFLSPAGEWDKVVAEETTPRGIIEKYALLLAFIPAVSHFIGFSIVGYARIGTHTYRVGMIEGIVHLIVQYLFALAGVIIVAYVIDTLSIHFGMQKNLTEAFKVSVYPVSIVWAAGIFYIIPALSPLALLVSLYALYHFYLGIVKVKTPPKEKLVPFIIAVIVLTIIVMAITGFIMGLFFAVNTAIF